MSAQKKTAELLRLTIPLSLMVKNEDNPNKMSKRAFDLLIDNFEKTGWTDPALARPFDLAALTKIAKKYGWPNRKKVSANEEAIVKEMTEQNLMVKIVGGHHRFDAGSYLGLQEGPVTVIMDSDFDEDAEKFQMVRMNMIHGKLDSASFIKLYNQVAGKYGDDILQEAFGFEDEAEFNRVKNQIAKSIQDPQMKKQFLEDAKEIKTIDGLAQLLNAMFTKYGDTLPYGYMIFDHNGQRSMWLRIEGPTMKSLELIGQMCIENKRTVDDVVGSVLQLIAKGESKEFMAAIIAETPEVEIKTGMELAPTKDTLEKIAAVS